MTLELLHLYILSKISNSIIFTNNSSKIVDKKPSGRCATGADCEWLDCEFLCSPPAAAPAPRNVMLIRTLVLVTTLSVVVAAHFGIQIPVLHA